MRLSINSFIKRKSFKNRKVINHILNASTIAKSKKNIIIIMNKTIICVLFMTVTKTGKAGSRQGLVLVKDTSLTKT